MTNEEAIFIINNRLNTYYCSDDDLKALDLAIEALEEKPKGKWEFREEKSFGFFYKYMSCSNCHKEYSPSLFPKNFCPNCGADMRGEV